MLITAAALAGCCATQKPVADTDQPDGDTKPVVGAVAAGTRLVPLEQRSLKVRMTEGVKAGQTLTVTIQRAADGSWIETVESMRVMHMRQADGAVVMTREDDLGEKVIVEYDPPLVVMPATLSAQQPFEAQTQMTVRNLADGSPRDKGTCRYTVQLDGQRSVATPAGKFDAYVVRSRRLITLKLAKVDVTIFTAHVPGRGRVITRVDRHTQALGILAGRKIEEYRLAPP